MKNSLLLFLFLFISSIGCKAQQMVQTPEDAIKIKENEQQFLNKPMSNLFKEIKPEIKMVMGTRDYPSYFAFRFISIEESRRHQKGRKVTTIYVYVKELIDWDFDKRPKGKEYVWTKEDAEKFDGLDVIRIKVLSHIEE